VTNISDFVGVVPCAGTGGRCRPLIPAIPKELLPVGIVPALDHVLRELLSVGLKRIVLVVPHFKPSLLTYLLDFCERYRLPEETFPLVLQGRRPGLGEAIRLAGSLFPDYHQCVALPDEIVRHDRSPLRQQMGVSIEYGTSVLSIRSVERELLQHYGVPRLGHARSAVGPWSVTAVIEKPIPDEAPSSFALLGRFVLTPDFLAELEHDASSSEGELFLDPTLNRMAHRGSIVATEFTGSFIDIGTLRSWRTAIDTTPASDNEAAIAEWEHGPWPPLHLRS
jgi:UTP--glucose-1-phosphate uridylyltransferase